MNSDVQRNEKKIISQSELLNKKLHKLLKVSKYNELEEQFEKLNGLSTLEIGVINAVYHTPNIISKEICEQLKIPKTTLTSVIDRMEGRNYLKRVNSERDKRSFGLQLTEDGILAQKEHWQFEYVVCNKIILALGTDEKRQMLVMLIDQIIENLAE